MDNYRVFTMLVFVLIGALLVITFSDNVPWAS